MSLAYKYGDCYWNASGEFECIAEHKLVSDKATENDIRKYPNLLPLPEYRHFVQPTNNYAKVPIEYLKPDRYSIEAYQNHAQCGAESNLTSTDRTDRLSPLNREMEVSIYLPNKENQINGDSTFAKNQCSSELTVPITPVQTKPYANAISVDPNYWSSANLNNTKKQLPKATNDMKNYPKTSNQMVQNYRPSIRITWNQNSKYFQKFRTKVHKYYFQLPYQKYYQLVDELGPPSLINPNKGGIAIWQSSTLKKAGYPTIQRIDLVDEQCFNSFPCPHIGFLYTHVKIIIPMSKISNILSLCGDIMFDPIKNILVVRGMTLNYNLALIALICLYVNGRITWYNILEADLVRQALAHHQLTNRRVQKQNLAIINKYLMK